MVHGIALRTTLATRPAGQRGLRFAGTLVAVALVAGLAVVGLRLVAVAAVAILAALALGALAWRSARAPRQPAPDPTRDLPRRLVEFEVLPRRRAAGGGRPEQAPWLPMPLP